MFDHIENKSESAISDPAITSLTQGHKSESINQNFNRQIVKKIHVKNTSYTIIDQKLKHEDDNESYNEFNNLYSSLNQLKNGQVYEVLNHTIHSGSLDQDSLGTAGTINIR